MATILVDYENVHGTSGLKGVEVLQPDDVLVIFFSEACRQIKREYMQQISDSKCRFRIVKLKNSGKNALDFYIAVECGSLYANGARQIAIISNDKGFQAIVDYFSINEATSEMHIVRAGNIENALMLLDTPENHDRRVALKQKACMLDLVKEHTRIEERESIAIELKDAIKGTEYETRMLEIIDLLEHKKQLGNKVLYTSALHSFGKTAGTEIYHLMKKIVV